MSCMCCMIVKCFVSVKNEMAMFIIFNEVDFIEVMKLCKIYQDCFVEKYGIKFGFMLFFVKVCVKVFMEMLDVNVKFDGDNLVYYDYVDVFIVVFILNGLVVFLVYNVELLFFVEIEYKIKELVIKVCDGKFIFEEMLGGIFIIINGGIFGFLLSMFILNELQLVIFGMYGIKNCLMVIDGEVKI